MSYMPRESNTGSLTKQDIWAFVLIIFLGTLYHWFLKSEIIVTNSDDIKSLYRGFIAVNGGLDVFFENTIELAKIQGRFYFVITDFFSHLPYLIEPEWLRSLLLSSVYTLAGLSVSYYVYLFTRRVKPSQIFLIIYLTCVPVYGAWYAYYHWPLYWYLPILFFTLGLIFWNYSTREGRGTPLRVLTLLLYCFFTFSAIMFSEMYFMFCGVMVFLILLRHMFHGRIIGIESLYDWRYMISKWRIISVSFAPFLIYLSLYMHFMINAADKVNRVSSKLSFNFDLVLIFNSVKTFFVAAFPVNHLTLAAAYRYLVSQYKGIVNSETVIPLFTMISILVCVFLAVWSIWWCFSRRKTYTTQLSMETIATGYPLWLKVLLPIIIGYIFISIHVLTPFYQNWLTEFRPWYTPVFHLSVAMIIAFVLGAEHLIDMSHALFGNKKIVISILALFFVALVMSVSVFSALYTRTTLKERNIVWHLMYQLRSAEQKSLFKNNEAILFSELKPVRELDRSSILSVFMDRDLKVFPDSNNRIGDYDWVIHVSYGNNPEDSYVVFGRPIDRVDNVDVYREVWLTSYSSLYGKKPAVITREGCSLPLLDMNRSKNMYRVKTEKNFVIHDVELVDARRHAKITECL